MTYNFKNTIITIFSFSIAISFWIFDLGNTADILPDARHMVNSNWVPGDWYLDQEVGYRILFNLIAGPIYEISNSFLFTFLFLKILSLVGFIWIFCLWFKQFELPLWLLPLFLFFLYTNRCIVAREWFIESVESKSFAYLSFFLGFYFFTIKKYRWSCFLIGLSLSFHVLVGGYLVTSLVMGLLILYRKEFFKWPGKGNILVFVIGALNGILAIGIWAKNIIEKIPSTSVWDPNLIYVLVRVPHHVYPDWSLNKWFFEFIFYQAVFLWILTKGKKFIPDSLHLFFATILSSSVFFYIGLFLYYNEKFSLLKFYWFRVPDVMLPTAFSIAILFLIKNKFPQVPQKIRNIIIAGIFFAILIYAIEVGKEDYSKFTNKIVKKKDVYSWIQNNTNVTDTFIINPFDAYFYIHAERPILAGFKFSPQQEDKFVEWYERIRLLNPGSEYASRGAKLRREVSKNYLNLKEEKISNIAKKYNIKYFVTKSAHKLNFPIAYIDQSNCIYLVSPR